MVTLIDTPHIAFLVEQARKGNEQAFETLHDTFRGAVYKTAQYRVGNQHAADVAQETFYRAYRYLRTLRKPDQFGPWLMRIARNVCRDVGVEQGVIRAQEPYDVDELSQVLTNQVHMSLDERLDLDQLLKSVPPNYVTFIVLHYLREFTVPEISLVTGLSVSTVKWRIQRGLELCRLAALKQQGGIPDANEEVKM